MFVGTYDVAVLHLSSVIKETCHTGSLIWIYVTFVGFNAVSQTRSLAAVDVPKKKDNTVVIQNNVFNFHK